MELRSLLLGPAIALGLAAFAQPVPPFNVTVAGFVPGCSPSGYVNIVSVQGTVPSLDIDVPLDANCGFTIDLTMGSYNGWFQFTTPCNGSTATAVGSYQITFLDSASVFVTINCGNGFDCLNVEGGTALPGTACDDGDPNTFDDTWTASCMCVGSPALPCEACFTATQGVSGPGTIPFTALLSNCSSGGVAPYSYEWSFDGGLTYEPAPADTAFVFAEGSFLVCLQMTSADGCTSVSCDTLVVDENGTINPVNVAPCQAGFFVMQAYQWVDSAANPNGGGGEPIPNELWLWNLSSGGTGNFQFIWSWGDGTASSEAFPSHTYANGGTYTICLSVNDNAGCTSTYCQDITVDGDGILGGFMGAGNRSSFTIRVMDPLSTGVVELPTISGLNAWPNPVNDVLNVTLESRFKGNLRIAITDLSGRVVVTDTRSINDGRNNLSLPVSELNAGLYVISISNGTTAVSERFVKVR